MNQEGAAGWWTIARDAVRGWLACDPFTCAGSLAPVVFIAVSAIGLVLGERAAQGRTVARLRDATGRDAGGRPVATPRWPPDEVALAWAGLAVAVIAWRAARWP